MTKKLWFQVGVGLLLSLLIIKYFIEIKTIFSPLVIIAKVIFVPLLLGAILFYITEPLQRLLEKRKVPRWGSITAILLLMVGLLWIAVVIVGPLVADQIDNLVKNIPFLANELTNVIDYVLQNKDHFPPQVHTFIDNAVNSIQTYATTATVWILQFIQSVVSATFILILVPFFFIFMLKDHEKLAPFIFNFFTGERKAWVKKTLTDCNQVLRSYIQGQLLISFFLALMMFIGYLIIGLDYALLLAIFAFFMNVIPFIGPWIAFTPALIIGFIQDPKLAIWVCVVTLVAQQIDGNLITPNVMGKSLQIHPLTVITIILAAGNIAGFIGIVLAIPAYAVGKAIVKNIYEKRKEIKQTATKTV